MWKAHVLLSSRGQSGSSAGALEGPDVLVSSMSRDPRSESGEVREKGMVR